MLAMTWYNVSPAQIQVSEVDTPIVAHMTLTSPKRHFSCNASLTLSPISAWYTPVLIRPSLIVDRSSAIRSESYTMMTNADDVRAQKHSPRERDSTRSQSRSGNILVCSSSSLSRAAPRPRASKRSCSANFFGREGS
jgi:hypothetical protein